jgi:hypothetical protein
MNNYVQKQVSVIVKVINMALVLLLVSSISGCGSGRCVPNADGTDCLPPTAQPPTPTLAPPPMPVLIEVRAGPGDGTRVDPDNYLLTPNVYALLPASPIKIITRQIDFLHFGLVATINNESIPQVGSGGMGGDEAKFTFDYIQNGNEDQEVITVQPKAEDRSGPGFIIRISATSGNITSQPLTVFIYNPKRSLPPCVEKSLPVVGGPPYPASPYPIIIPSNNIALSYASHKLSYPSLIYKLAIGIGTQSIIPFHTVSNGVLVEIADNSSLSSDEALISLVNNNTNGWNKTIRALDSTCKYTNELVTSPETQSVGPLKITKLDTTTLVIFKDVGITDPSCTPLIVCTKMVAVWSEPLFWDLFGGKNVTFTWFE